MLERVAEGVLIHRSEVLRNNTVVVEGPTGALLVDPGLTEAEMSCLAADLRERDLPVAAGFATHPDWDHVLWHPAFGDAPRYGTAACASFMRTFLSDPDWKTRAAEGLPPEIAEETPLDLYGRITAVPADATRLPWGGPSVQIIEHRGHAPGHAALLVQGVLIAGDMLSDLFIPMLDDPRPANDPVPDYLAALQRFEDLAPRIHTVVPGHGSPTDAVRTRIDLDRAYLHALRNHRTPDDPRLTTPEPGWEWTTEIHTAQARTHAPD